MEESKIDREVLEEMLAKKVELSYADEKEFRRAELNFYAELLSQLRETAKKIDAISQTLNMIGNDRLVAYFNEFKANFIEVQKKEAVQNIVNQSHMPAKRVSRKNG